MSINVILEGSKSNQCEVNSGVPQGSVLGPLLFMIYINDLTDDLSSVLFLFADDLTLVRCISKIGDCAILNEDINKINSWCELNNMEINVKKNSCA